MAKHTKIEYCDSTVNPVPGCSGCELYHPDPARNHCYAAQLINRYAGKKGWPESFTQPKHFPERLPQAIKWPDLTGTKRDDKPWLDGYPRVIFVNDLGDLFCPAAPSATHTLLPHLVDMAESPHYYLILTKWPDVMMELATTFYACFEHEVPDNILWGTTVTSGKTIYRIDQLLGSKVDKHPAYQRVLKKMRKWVSFEPLLEQVDPAFRNWVAMDSRNIDWAAVGGESGSNARLFRAYWLRVLIQDCFLSGVPLFVKQLGSHNHPGKGNDWDTWQEDLKVRKMFFLT